MSFGMVKRFGKKTLAIALALSLSVMMIPAVAFADSNNDPDPADFEFAVVVDGGKPPATTKTENIDTDKSGMLVEAKDDGVAEGTLEGSISSSGTGVEVVAYDYSEASGKITGDVTSTGNQQPYGVIVETQEAFESAVSQAEVGNVEAPNGFKVQADGGTATIVAESITSTDDDDERVTANLVSANGGKESTFGTANADLGSITSASNGVSIEVDPMGVAVVNVGEIEADIDGINIENLRGIVIVTVSEVEAGRTGIYSHVSKDDSTNMVFVDGNVKAANHSALNIQNDIRNKQMVLVANDATSEATFERSGGLFFYGSDVNVQVIALVAGVLSGFNGVVLERDGYANPQEILDLTTWKIEANGGELIRNDNDKADTDAFAKSISYIVRIEQPAEGGTVYVTNADGSELEKKFAESSGLYGEMLDIYKEQTGKDAVFVDAEGYEVAHETDKVLLKVDLEPGYRLVAAYNGEGEKVELLVDDDGNYYVVVPRGGGINLSVELEKESYDVTFDLAGGTVNGQAGPIVKTYEYGTAADDIEVPANPVKEADEEYTYEFAGWSPTIADVTGETTYTAQYDATPIPPAPVEKGTLTFDLGGGTLDGQTGTITIEANVGDTITLPGAPTREGYTFKCWKGSEYAAGAEYKVKGDHAFTAEWEKDAEPEPEPKPVIPATGDPLSAAPFAVLAFVAAGFVGVAVRRCRD